MTHHPPRRPAHGARRCPSALALLVALTVAAVPLVATPATADDAPTPSPVHDVADAPGLAAFDLSSVPTLTGTAAVGSPLAVVTGDWSPTPTFTYRWLADGATVEDAISSTYAPTAAEVGTVITVEVTGTAPGRVPTSLTSEGTDLVQEGIFPEPSSVPTVSGAAQVGSTLTAAPGTWPLGATLSYQWFAGGVAIDGAVSSTYSIAPSDLGTALSVQVTGTQAGWETAVRISEPTSAVVAATFASAPVPTISGATTVGATLTAVPGSWSPGATLSYQWSAGGTLVPGATQTTYVPAAADLGKQLTVEVTATLPGWVTVTRTSAKSASISRATFSAAPVPTISGKVRVGTPLTAAPGTWAPTATLTYQWRVGGTAVKGATKTTYVPSVSDLGKKITVQVTGTKTGWTSVTRTSTATTAVASGAFTGAPVPTISGTARAGATLRATPGTWTPGATLTYQWKADGAVIKGATAAKLVPTAAQVGKKVTVQVTGKRAGWTTTTKTSAATRAVAAGVFTTAPTPTITGAARTGSTLTAKPGTWSPSATLSYQWYAGGAPVSGARSATWVPTTAQVGKKITVKVTAKRSGWVTTARTSAATAAVTTPPVVPSGDGRFRVGSQISPGTYVSSGSEHCYWERRSNATDDFAGIIANDFGSGQRIVTISPKDKYFFSDYCGGWKPLPTTGKPKTAVTKDGIYAVGTQLAPGRYRAKGNGELCYYAALTSFSGELGAIRINGLSKYTQEVVIKASDVGFESSRCGTWTKVG